jgi:zinc finger HIT domain-containing protein 1
MLRKKFNLKKLLREGEPGFAGARAGASRLPGRKVCSVCGGQGRGRCFQCYESFCGLRCHTVHKEIRCNE